jgi:hypothetical protein
LNRFEYVEFEDMEFEDMDVQGMEVVKAVCIGCTISAS